MNIAKGKISNTVEDMSSSLIMIMDKTSITEVASMKAASALEEAEMYQANEHQKDMFARTQEASNQASMIFNDVLNISHMAQELADAAKVVNTEASEKYEEGEQRLATASEQISAINELIEAAKTSAASSGMCVNDEMTPQACLDEWTASFDITPRDCYLDYEEKAVRNMDQVDYVYMLYHGGCLRNGLSIDIEFEQTSAAWENITIDSDANYW